MSESPVISVDDRGEGVTVVTMDSPPVNAMTAEFVDMLAAVVGDLTRSAARAIVLTGRGEYFCAGGDIGRFPAIRTRGQAMEFVTDVQGLLDTVAAIPAPVIAAINGHALGGGLELALACDIRIVGAAARMGLPETRWGLLAGAGGTQRLARLVGPGAAKLMMYTAEPVPADEALRIGLIDKAAASADPLPEALTVAAAIAANSPVAVRAVKRCVDEGLDQPLAAGLALERDYWADLIPHGDYLEGAGAFFDKRQPRYPDIAPSA